MYNLVSTLAPSFLIGSSPYLQVKRKNILSQISLNFGQVLPRNVELATLWCLKNSPIVSLWGNCSEHSSAFIMPPTLKKWGTYWFRLVRMYSCSRYRLETSCMDSSWKNSRRVFLVFPELSPLVKLRPFDKQGDEIL